MSPGRPARDGDHETYDELAVGWALHALEPEDEALFGRHLPDCTRCARTVAETSEVMAVLATDLPPAEPSEEFRHRLRTAIKDTEQVQEPVLPPDQPAAADDEIRSFPTSVEPLAPGGRPGAGAAATASRRAAGSERGEWRRRLPAVLAAVAAALVVALGAWDVALSGARAQAEATARDQAHIMAALLSPGQATIAPVSDPDGRPVATVVARHAQVQVVTWGLSANNRIATTYVAWGVRNGAPPVALGTFDVVQSGMDLRTVGSDRTGLNGFSSYVISIEPGRRAPSTPTDMVANGQVTS